MGKSIAGPYNMFRIIFIGVCFLISYDFYGQTYTPLDNLGELVKIKGGKTTIGNANFEDAQPLLQVKVYSFQIQKNEVTNAQFAQFVAATNYQTLAEKNGGSFVFQLDFPKDSTELENSPWWEFTEGANWKHPQGANSSIQGKENYPAIHIGYEDACAYCAWLEMRLPTEVEWEYAARQNGEVTQFNNWQGNFPYENTLSDGFMEAAPVGNYPAGKLGLYDMQGNVWEWCLDSYHAHAYHYASESKILSYKPLVPTGFDPYFQNEETKVIRGGSFLCAENSCRGYALGMRMRSSVEMTFSHIGFRGVKGKK